MHLCTLPHPACPCKIRHCLSTGVRREEVELKNVAYPCLLRIGIYYSFPKESETQVCLTRRSGCREMLSDGA